MSYPAGMSPIQAQHRQSPEGRHSMGASQSRGSRRGLAESESEGSSEEGEETESSEEEDDEDELQIVKVVQRPAPSGVQRRTVSGSSRGSRGSGGGRARKSR
jgi:Ulp1 family protease